MTGRHNFGSGNAGMLIGVCALLNFWQLILFICFLMWLPWWVYAIGGSILAASVYFIFKGKK